MNSEEEGREEGPDSPIFFHARSSADERLLRTKKAEIFTVHEETDDSVKQDIHDVKREGDAPAVNPIVPSSG